MAEIPINELYKLTAVSHTAYNREIHNNHKSRHLAFQLLFKNESPLEYRVKDVSAQGKVQFRVNVQTS